LETHTAKQIEEERQKYGVFRGLGDFMERIPAGIEQLRILMETAPPSELQATMLEIMKQTPSEAEGLLLMDVATIQTDEDLEEFYGMLTLLLIGDVKYLGISLEHIEYYAMFSLDEVSGNVGIFRGDLDFHDVEKTLEEAGGGPHQYRGAEVWDYTYEDFMGEPKEGLVTFTDNWVVFGNPEGIHAFVDCMRDETDSLYDSEGAVEIIDRIPTASMFISCGRLGDFEGNLFSGTAFIKVNSTTLKVVGQFKFRDAEDARNSMQDIEDDLTQDDATGWREIEVTRNDDCVLATAETGISDLFGKPDTAEIDPETREKQNLQLAMTAVMAEGDGTFAISEVEPQTTWTNDMTGNICDECISIISDYLEESTTEYYYRWDSTGKVYQCEDKSCPAPF
ncbi:MAG: hypothetical protein R6U89_05560, partial [Dehalococcoidia bacterium]